MCKLKRSINGCHQESSQVQQQNDRPSRVHHLSVRTAVIIAALSAFFAKQVADQLRFYNANNAIINNNAKPNPLLPAILDQVQKKQEKIPINASIRIRIKDSIQQNMILSDDMPATDLRHTP